MGRETNDPAIADDAPQVERQQVLLPDVHAVGAGEHRHVRAIVDDESRGRGLRVGRDVAGEVEKRAARERLGAKLQQASAAVEAGARQIARRPPGGLRYLGVDDGVERRENQALSASAVLGRGW
jgi:hypothetical protein